MIIASILFYIFSFITLASVITVVSVRNPVYSVLALIVAFFSSAGIFLLIGAEFIAMTLIIVYVGAVAVLFLFVVMMLNVNLTTIKKNFPKYNLLIIPIILILVVDFTLLFKGSFSEKITLKIADPVDKAINNTHILGQILYTKYIYHIQVASVILLVAMIGSIALTLRMRINAKVQNLSKQLDRNKDNSLEIIKYNNKAN